MPSVEEFEQIDDQLERGVHYAVYFRNTYSFARTVLVIKDLGEYVLVYSIGRHSAWKMSKMGYTFHPLNRGISL